MLHFITKISFWKTVSLFHSGGNIEEIPVPKVDPRNIVDTTGAGDAFCAGNFHFISILFANKINSTIHCIILC